ATARDEALRGIPLDAQNALGFDLRSIRRGLVMAMADAINRRVPDVPKYHRRLIEQLRLGHRLNHTSFISTNYDTLIDSALEDTAIVEERDMESVVDYGFGELTQPATLADREDRRFLLCKLHGSLNWLHCPVCFDLVISMGPDVISRLIDDSENSRCVRC